MSISTPGQQLCNYPHHTPALGVEFQMLVIKKTYRPDAEEVVVLASHLGS